MLDNISIGIGVLAVQCLAFVRAENDPKLSFSQVLRANFRAKRGVGVFVSLLVSAIAIFTIGYFMIVLVHASNQGEVLCGKTRHFVIPFLVTLTPTFMLSLIIKTIGKQLAIKGFVGSPLRLIQFINERTVYLWKTCINIASAALSEDVIECDTNGKTVRMLFERTKICIALQQKEPYILRTYDERKKTHFLMNYYGYEDLLDHLEDDHFIGQLHDDFELWDGYENRQKTIDGSEHRLGDKKHLRSAVSEGMA